MSEDSTRVLQDRLRSELNRTRGTARTEIGERSERARQRAMEEFEHQAEGARRELGERLVDLTEEYFPEATRRRRRRAAAAAFAAGVGAGFLARHALRR